MTLRSHRPQTAPLRWRERDIPDAPGPPGLRKSDPIRLSGPDAGMPGTAARAGSATQVPVAIGVHTAVAVSHFWSCEVRRLIWIVVFISGVEYSLAMWVTMSTVPIVPAMSMPASGSANQMLPSGPRVSGPGLNDVRPAAFVTG